MESTSLAAKQWRERVTAVLELALTAPSTRNTQPWIFEWIDGEVRVRGDPSRQQKFADANRRELDISLGCLIENLSCAAEHARFTIHVDLVPDPRDAWLAARVRFEDGGEASSVRARFGHDVLRARHTEHGEFASGSVNASVAGRVRASGDGAEVHVEFLDTTAREACARLVDEADRRLFADSAWRRELAERLASGELGPPRWIGGLIGFGLEHHDFGPKTASSEAQRVREAPYVGVIATRDDTFDSRLRAGMSLERIWLSATIEGLALQPLSGPLEIEELRERCAVECIARGWIVQQLFRLGRAHVSGHRRSSRRPLDAVLRV